MSGKASSVLGPPDLVIKSEPYTMAAHHQDVWWRPVSDIPLTEPRWGRAVEMRPGLGRGPQDHAPCRCVSGAGRSGERCARRLRCGSERAGDADGVGGRQGL